MNKINPGALLFPFLAIFTIILYAGGLGILFMVINNTSIHEWGVIILGIALVVGVPMLAMLSQRLVERN